MDHEHRIRWFAREVLPHEGDIRRWLSHRLRGLASCDLDEVIQETYARLWAVDSESIVNVRAYMFVTARRVVGETVRRSRIVPIETVADIDALNIADGDASPERRVSGREEIERLHAIIDRLPPKCRQAFVLKKFQSMPQRQIAQRMNIAESTVEKHLAKALKLVMQQMWQSPAVPAQHSRPHERHRNHR